jgi:hypothetical protein
LRHAGEVRVGERAILIAIVGIEYDQIDYRARPRS